ncbi:hypothetical protein GCM10020000_84570 [Streptomyces olivoverticillatus]
MVGPDRVVAGGAVHCEAPGWRLAALIGQPGLLEERPCRVIEVPSSGVLGEIPADALTVEAPLGKDVFAGIEPLIARAVVQVADPRGQRREQPA